MSRLADAAESRSWVAEARCALPEYADRTWVADISQSRESPKAVASLIEICAACPVRLSCLVETLMEDRYTVMGVFGGTSTRERTQVLSSADRPNTDSALYPAWVRDHRVRAVEAAETLEASLAGRLEWWRRSAHRTTEPERYWCARCGQGSLWNDPVIHCTRFCRRVERKQRRLEAVA